MSNDPNPCCHRGDTVHMGPYRIRAGGLNYLIPSDFDGIEVIIPLEPKLALAMGQEMMVLACPWIDFAPPPAGFEDLLRQKVIQLLKRDKQILVYCVGGHGRTGTFLASLIAILEPETDDPIGAVWERYCIKAVETKDQGAAIFALRGEELPDYYQRTL